MEKLVSVIIPTKNSEKTIKMCLQSIKNQTYKRIEIIVVDNDSIDKTKVFSKEYANKIINKGPERSAQRNYGARIAKGDYLLFIDSDMKLNKNVVLECVKSINSYRALIIPEKSFGTSFWAKCKALERSFYLGVEWMEGCRFILREVFINLGGYDEKQTGTEDFDFPQKIKKKFGTNSVGRINSYIYHNEGELRLANTLMKKFYYVQTLDRYASSNLKHLKKQANPIERYKLFFSNPKKLFENPIIGIGMLIMKTCEFISGGAGYLFSKRINKL